LRVLGAVERLGEATPLSISRELMISLSYAEYLCQYLVSEGRLEFIPANRFRVPTKSEASFIDSLQGDRGFIEQLAGEIAKRLGLASPLVGKGVEIKTDFSESISLEDAEMETNIDRVNTVEEKGREFETALELLRRLRSREDGG
jgi:hypothetical protein